MAESFHAVIDQVGDVLDRGEFLDVCHRREMPGFGGEYREEASGVLHEKLRGFVAHQYPSGLYLHQAEALGQIPQGKHVVISTGTSSGRTLVFAASMMNALLSDDDATALLIYPLKALANDQLEPIRGLRRALGMSSADCGIEQYDGDTPKPDRAAVRGSAKVIVTNPDMLHVGILNNHFRWQRFFENLRFVSRGRGAFWRAGTQWRARHLHHRGESRRGAPGDVRERRPGAAPAVPRGHGCRG